MTFEYFLKRKSEVKNLTGDYVEFFERKGDRVKNIRSDNGGEFGYKRLMKYILERGIAFENITQLTPQQNDVTEGTNSILIYKARSVIQCMTVSTKVWGGSDLYSSAYSKV